MQTTMVQGSRPASYSATHVWDLDSASQHRSTRRARPSHAGPIAASFGLAALCAAAFPSAAIETRLFFTIGFGLVSVLAGFSALRRRQTMTTLVLALVGVAAPVIAIALVIVHTAQEPATVTSATVERATLQPDSSGMVPTREVNDLAPDEQNAMKSFLLASVLQMQTMHGSWAPFPRSLAMSNGVLVEGDGLFRGTTLGAVPQGEKLTYQVSSDGTAFRIAISTASDPRAMIWADRGRAIPTGG